MAEAETTNPPSSNTEANPLPDGSLNDPNAADIAGTGGAPGDSGSGEDCNQGSGSPSYTGNEGGDTPVSAPGTPVPPNPALRTNTNVDFQGNELPSLPTNGNFNTNAANIRLSKYFTLYDFLHPALGKPKSIPMGGKTVVGKRYTAQQLLQNMRDLCVLCLDPIKHRYPKVVLTSTFRDKSDGSAHNCGWAADMQFYDHGLSGGQLKDVAYVIAGLGIPYDQLLYEYPSGNGSTWIHVGLRRPRDLSVRNQAWSFYYGNYPNDRRKRLLGPVGQFTQFPGLRPA